MNRENNNESTNFAYRYKKLDQLTNYNCEALCLCRFNEERTKYDRDIMDLYNPNKKENYIDTIRTNYDQEMIDKYGLK